MKNDIFARNDKLATLREILDSVRAVWDTLYNERDAQNVMDLLFRIYWEFSELGLIPPL